MNTEPPAQLTATTRYEERSLWYSSAIHESKRTAESFLTHSSSSRFGKSLGLLDGQATKTGSVHNVPASLFHRDLADSLMEICEPNANIADGIPGGYKFRSPIDMTIVGLNVQDLGRPSTFNVQVIFAMIDSLAPSSLRTVFHASGKTLLLSRDVIAI
jgi:hypothetical protein